MSTRHEVAGTIIGRLLSGPTDRGLYMPRINIFELIKERAGRALEIRHARNKYPEMEIGAAYKKWKNGRGETASILLSADRDSLKKEIQAVTTALSNRPCTTKDCNGVQQLEGVCSGCIEGQAGYRSKWTCKKCLHRDLSKETIEEIGRAHV